MIRPTRFFAAFLFATAALASQVSAQSSNLQYQVANMVEDQRLMMEQMRGLLAEMDELRRENARLLGIVQAFEEQAHRQSGSYATVAQVNELVRKTVADLSARDEVVQRELTALVSRELAAFGKKVTAAVNSVPTMDSSPSKKVFDQTGIPQFGIPHKVEPGESIASIAKKLNSRIDWIQNKNKISDPRLLQVGQVIFVPQESQ